MIRNSLVALVSLVAAATLVTGVTSYWRGVPEDSLWIDGTMESPRVRLAMIDGMLHVVYSGPRNADSGVFKKEFGQFYVKRVGIGAIDATGVGAPFWALLPILAAVPFTSFMRGPYRRRRRRKHGRCTHCGYNLTGLTEPRCPECGRGFLPPAPQSARE